jgi:hypothetical protein
MPATTGAFTLPMSTTSASGATLPAMATPRGTREPTGPASTTTLAPATAAAGSGSVSSTIPRSRATRAAAGSGSKPRTTLTSPAARAARASEPPM